MALQFARYTQNGKLFCVVRLRFGAGRQEAGDLDVWHRKSVLRVPRDFSASSDLPDALLPSRPLQ